MAKTHAQNGMATSRCPNCGAPLTDTLTSSCDFCGHELGSGERDWILEEALTVEAWNGRRWTRRQEAARASRAAGALVAPEAAEVMDAPERARLLAMMAALAAADGVVGPRERRLLQMCADRWSVPWETVEYALRHGREVFAQLVPKGGPEAEAFLRAVVRMALVDGRVDRKERRLLEDAARHLGIPEKLGGLLA